MGGNKKQERDKIHVMEVTFIYINGLLQRNEAGGVGGSNTRATVLNRLVCNGEFSKVVTNHLRLQEEKSRH